MGMWTAVHRVGDDKAILRQRLQTCVSEMGASEELRIGRWVVGRHRWKISSRTSAGREWMGGWLQGTSKLASIDGFNASGLGAYSSSMQSKYRSSRSSKRAMTSVRSV
jgi:hypothetical protein